MMKLKKVRWGRVSEIKHLRRVLLKNGKRSAPFNALPTRLKQLASWRRMHALRKHSTVSRYGRSYGYKPSSNLRLNTRKTGTKLAFIGSREAR